MFHKLVFDRGAAALNFSTKPFKTYFYLCIFQRRLNVKNKSNYTGRNLLVFNTSLPGTIPPQKPTST
jgi:hypothetical protein